MAVLVWGYNHYFGGSDDENLPAAVTGGQKYHATEILSTQPHEAVRTVYDAIAQNLPEQGCGRFAEPTQQRFAEDMGYPDCRQAIIGLNAQVKGVNDYAEPIFPPDAMAPPLESTTTISSCEMQVMGGPRLGEFSLARTDKGQWLITGHSREPQPCPPPRPKPSPTPSTSPEETQPHRR